MTIALSTDNSIGLGVGGREIICIPRSNSDELPTCSLQCVLLVVSTQPECVWCKVFNFSYPNFKHDEPRKRYSKLERSL